MISIDKEFRIPIYSPTCALCQYLTDHDGRKCSAFPLSIPLEIWKGENDHKKPFAGDQGIQFKEIP